MIAPVMRIGLISDTHIPVAAKELWPQVYEAFRGVDLIMHGGDLMVTDVIDWLEEVAPVMAVSGNGDYTGWERSIAPQDPRLSESRVLVVDSLRIGLVHDFQLPEPPPLRTIDGLITHFFSRPVNLIVRACTHPADITPAPGVRTVHPRPPPARWARSTPSPPSLALRARPEPSRPSLARRARQDPG